MTEGERPESRSYVRINVKINVRYKFICHTMKSARLDEVYNGSTSNLSVSGMLLHIVLPDQEWIDQLKSQRIMIGINAWLPDSPSPIRSLTRLMWIQETDIANKKYAVGLHFREITTEDQNKILQFVMDHELGQ